MVGHDDPLEKVIAFAVEVEKGVLDEGGELSFFEKAGAVACVFVVSDLLVKLNASFGFG